MSSVKQQLEKLIGESNEMLSELQSDAPSVDLIQTRMDDREKTIRELGSAAEGFDINQLTGAERDSVQTLFNTFEEVNKEIDTALKHVLRESRENLSSATKKRKADDKYRVLEKPDISYF